MSWLSACGWQVHAVVIQVPVRTTDQMTGPFEFRGRRNIHVHYLSDEAQASMPVCTFSTLLRKDQWELTKSGEGKSELTSLSIRDSGVNHQMECLWRTGPFAGEGSRPEALPSMELIGVAALITVESRHPWMLLSTSSQIRVSKSRPTPVLS